MGVGGTQGRSGRVREVLPPQEFDPRIVQHAASRYTDWAIAAPIIYGQQLKLTYKYLHFVMN